jgi:hypothetical protein
MPETYCQVPLRRPKKKFRRRLSLTTCKAEVGLSGLVIGDEHFIIIQLLQHKVNVIDGLDQNNSSPDLIGY